MRLYVIFPPEDLIRAGLTTIQVCGSLGLTDGELLLVGIRLGLLEIFRIKYYNLR